MVDAEELLDWLYDKAAECERIADPYEAMYKKKAYEEVWHKLMELADQARN